MEDMRENYRSLVGKYVGSDYANNTDGYGRTKKKYLNLMHQGIEAYMMVLAANRPAVLMSTIDDQLKPFARRFQIAVNNLCEEIEFGETIAECVLDAFFGMGVAKIHMADSGETIAEEDILMDPGIPFVSHVSTDDFVYDTGARRWHECQFMGDLYQVSKKSLIDRGIEEERLVKADPMGITDRVEDMARTEPDMDRDSIDLADIFVPSEQKVYTFIVSNRHDFRLAGDPIDVMDWEGNEKGPYRHLSFNSVPQNIRPLPPALIWEPLDTLVNSLMLKSKAQARRSKSITTYTAAGSDAMQRIKNAADGEAILVNNIDDIKQMTIGGIDPANQAAMMQFLGLTDRMMGNLTAMLGLGTSSDTVGQEKLVYGANSRKEQAMRQTVAKFVTDVVRGLAHLLWDDQFKTIPGEFAVDGYPELTADASWTPDRRDGDFADYKITIDVYSMQYQGPAERASTVKQLLLEIYAPMMAAMQQQGGTIDMMAMTDMFAELLNLPRLKDVVKFVQPQQAENQGSGGQYISTKPNTSNRNYTRTSVSGGNPSMDPGAVAKAAAAAE